MIEYETLTRLVKECEAINDLEELFAAWEVNMGGLSLLSHHYAIEATAGFNRPPFPREFITAIRMSFVTGFLLGYKASIERELNSSDG